MRPSIWAPGVISRSKGVVVGLQCRVERRTIALGGRWASTRAPDFAAIDAKWQQRWKQHDQWQSRIRDKGKYYVLPMFPYPSGALHIGHLRNYTISDVIARYRRMKGYDVLHPIGWDAFGLPAENAAIERGIDPAVWTSDNIAKMKQQIEAMGGCWDWDRELRTCDPEFFKDTQMLFLALHKQGLAYQKEALVNFDPVDRTVLANEQVDSNGFSWRSGAKVEQLTLKQWFFKITDYAPQLLQDLERLEAVGKWPSRVVAMQKAWLGRSDGAILHFGMSDTSGIPPSSNFVNVFTTRPDTLFGVQYIALSLYHPLIASRLHLDDALKLFVDQARDLEPDSKAGYRLPDIAAQNPLLNIVPGFGDVGNVPVYAAPYVRSDYGNGAVMGVPAHDARDFAFWQQNAHSDGQPRFVIQEGEHGSQGSIERLTARKEAFTSQGYLGRGCHQYSGLSSNEAIPRIMDDLAAFDKKLARRSVGWRLRDWLISRQRYWGTPIPIVHCKDCGAVPVPESDIPVKLPTITGHEWQRLRGNPLEKQEDWLNTPCPKCGAAAKRETDTMDTFVDSSWYYLKFAHALSQEQANQNHMPVDLYIGGIEHAILHLLYARFISKFLSQGEANPALDEPFERLLTQGMVHGRTYSDPISGRFLKPEEIDWTNADTPKIKSTGAVVNISFEKMSKSKHNGVDPVRCMEVYGADTTRAHLLFQAPVSEVLEWDEAKIAGVQRWFGRIWNLAHDLRNAEHTISKRPDLDAIAKLRGLSEDVVDMWKAVQSTIESVEEAYSQTYALNTVVSGLMTLTNKIQQITSKQKDDVTEVQDELVRAAYQTLLRLLTPVAPSFAEECWSIQNHLPQDEPAFDVTLTATLAGFPKPDGSLEPLQAQSQPCAVQFNGKLRFVASIPVPPADIGEDVLRSWVLPKVLQSPQALDYLEKTGLDMDRAKKIIVVRRGRTVNVVI